MKNIISLIVTIIISFPMMSQDQLIQIKNSSYYQDSENVYFVVSNYLHNTKFLFPSNRPIIPLLDNRKDNSEVEASLFQKSGFIVGLDEFEKKYKRSGNIYNPITPKLDTHSTFAIKLSGVTIESLKDFKLFSVYYVSIGSKVFIDYKELEGADAETFQVIDAKFQLTGIGYSSGRRNLVNSDYSKDKNSVFYNHHKIVGADASSFEMIDFVYSKDKNSVFYNHHKIVGADASSFEIIDFVYSKDKNSFFFKGAVLDNSDIKSFAMMGNYQKDDNHVWFDGKLLDDIDTETLRVLVKNPLLHNPHFYDNYTDYAIDENFVFYQGNRMLKVDPKSFKVIFSKSNITYGIDNTHVYSDGKIIKDTDPKTFKE